MSIRPFLGRIAAVIRRPATPAMLHAFWRHPDSANRPEDYLRGPARTRLLLDLVGAYVTPNEEVLDLGCNSGRNLAWLVQAGYLHLTGVDINPDAIALLRKMQPELADAEIVVLPIEQYLPKVRARRFGLVYTMATLEHLHPLHEAEVFYDIVRVLKPAGVLITIEDEYGRSWRHTPRNYREVFESRGLEQRNERGCDKVEGLGKDFVARVFVKP